MLAFMKISMGSEPIRCRGTRIPQTLTKKWFLREVREDATAVLELSPTSPQDGNHAQ